MSSLNEERPFDRLRDPETGRWLESVRAHAAFLDYCRMGHNRSLRLLYARFVQRKSNGEITAHPTHNTICSWSMKNHWQDRVKQWDADVARREAEEWESRRRANKESRINALTLLQARAAQILTRIEPNNLTSETALEHLYNATAALNAAVRGLQMEFNDLPAQRSEVSGPNGAPVQMAETKIYIPDNGRGDG